ncbi:hypothetical protein [Paenibacillus polymyxa]|uniref:Uncharacterized protein n=1 Tax=Paenibacillus polymyxa TaxID=1406 RepID=A0ABX2ZA83_PAEPO|nr:hypothetical protein [Paenibacillus polymyxa]ODA08216.1 hypothetical protein A7312_28035 [Paenibacillus polymyxa]
MATPIDGYAKVVTDDKGNVIYIFDYYFNNDNRFEKFTDQKIIQLIHNTGIANSELLVTLLHWQYDDNEGLDIYEQFVLKSNYKESLIEEVEIKKDLIGDWTFEVGDPFEPEKIYFQVDVRRLYEKIYKEDYPVK